MDKIAVGSLVAAVVAAFTGVLTFFFGSTDKEVKRLQEKTDEVVRKLGDVHGHLADMNVRMDAQVARDLTISRAQRVSIDVSGNSKRGQQITLRLVLVDASILLYQINLLNREGMRSGEISCERRNDHTYDAFIPYETFMDWWNTATKEHLNIVNRTAVLRAWFIIDSQQVYKDCSVTLTISSYVNKDAVTSIDGSC
jgi:hypothetical protein